MGLVMKTEVDSAKNAAPQVRCYYWRQHKMFKNLGDYLGVITVAALGFQCVNPKQTGPHILNIGRCLLPIGTVLGMKVLQWLDGPLDIWGCGWKGNALPADVMKRAVFHAVRGPRTVVGLELPSATPIGDPALLLPQLYPHQAPRHRRTLFIPHIFHMDGPSASMWRQRTGCDEVLSTWVVSTWPPRGDIALWDLADLLRARIKLGVVPHTAWWTVDRIIGADFVLTGSLHGAVLAQAYGIPWAAYDHGVGNVPEQWLDWAEYIDVNLAQVANLADGLRWWERYGVHGRIRDLQPLLKAFPYRHTEEY